MTKVLVCGGRDFNNVPLGWKALDYLHKEHKFTLVIDGAANGADKLANKWAIHNNIPTAREPADWAKHGKAAGIIRNSVMLEKYEPDLVIAFPGGTGTADMVRRAREAKVTVKLIVPKEKKLLKLALIAGLALAAPVYAQASASVATTGSTKIVAPISITKVTDLAFGTIVKSSDANTNTVTVNQTTGNRTITGTGTGTLVTSTATRAAYTVSGEGAQTFSVSVPATVTLVNGANNIIVTLTTTGATGTLSGTIGSTGTASVGVGGTFTLSSAQITGDYTGSFTVTVAYN